MYPQGQGQHRQIQHDDAGLGVGIGTRGANLDIELIRRGRAMNLEEEVARGHEVAEHRTLYAGYFLEHTRLGVGRRHGQNVEALLHGARHQIRELYRERVLPDLVVCGEALDPAFERNAAAARTFRIVQSELAPHVETVLPPREASVREYRMHVRRDRTGELLAVLVHDPIHHETRDIVHRADHIADIDFPLRCVLLSFAPQRVVVLHAFSSEEAAKRASTAALDLITQGRAREIQHEVLCDAFQARHEVEHHAHKLDAFGHHFQVVAGELLHLQFLNLLL